MKNLVPNARSNIFPIEPIFHFIGTHQVLSIQEPFNVILCAVRMSPIDGMALKDKGNPSLPQEVMMKCFVMKPKNHG